MKRVLIAIACLAAVGVAAQNPTPTVIEPAVSEPRSDPTRDPSRPAVFVVGDAMVKNHGPGEGWGDYLAPFFDDTRVQVVNWAREGSTARSFVDDGRWARVLTQIRAADYVLMTFGQNDLQQFIRDVRSKRATLILLSPVPRNLWNSDGSFNAVMTEPASVMAEVAAKEGVPFYDLHAAVASIYKEMGQAAVTSRFFTAGDSTHPNPTGAEVNAATVVDGLRSLPQVGLAALLKPTALHEISGRKPVTWARGIEGQRKADLGNGYYLNPIVSGDRPDPSILKDCDDYYMTFSSFEAYPGLVIWHSRDLINWTPIGPTLFKNVGSVWAPELVKHKGRYYIYFPGIGPYRSNYVIHANDIRGPWSEPIDLKNRRIDPGHAIGPDGKRYLFLSAGYLVPLSDDGLSIVGEEKHVYPGWLYPKEWIVEGFAQEGPKIIKKGDYYYQVLAQGGTAGPPTGHMIVAARSKTLEGPWEHSPYNPLVRAQSADEPWWSTGHGTLVEGPDGRWWMVYHAYEKGFYNLGRQTLLQPVEWLSDGWFRIAKYDPAYPIPKPVPASAGEHGLAYSDDFSTNKMGVQWSFYAGDASDKERYRYEDRALVLKAKGKAPSDSSPLWFVTGDHAYEVEVEIDADPDATAGLLLFYNRKLYVGLGFSAKNLIMHSYGIERPGAKPAHLGNRVHLRLRNDRQIVTIHYSVDGEKWERFDRGMEVSGYHHNVGYDFLSLRPALYAAGAGEVRFRNFKYRALP